MQFHFTTKTTARRLFLTILPIVSSGVSGASRQMPDHKPRSLIVFSPFDRPIRPTYPSTTFGSFCSVLNSGEYKLSWDRSIIDVSARL